VVFEKNIICIGAGYVGGPTMAMIAAKCPHYKVTSVDIDANRIDAWNSDQLPIYEPGLDELVKEARERNLFFSTDIIGAIKEADIIFVGVNTPTKEFGVGAGMASDLQYWEKTARMIKEHAQSDKIVVEKSTLPVKAAQAMERVLHAGQRTVHFEVLSNPEFLAEGTAVNDLEFPDRVLMKPKLASKPERSWLKFMPTGYRKRKLSHQMSGAVNSPNSLPMPFWPNGFLRSIPYPLSVKRLMLILPRLPVSSEWITVSVVNS
jgi:UDPglucose 6-dehydrogenase